jgi:hypothetical protein
MITLHFHVVFSHIEAAKKWAKNRKLTITLQQGKFYQTYHSPHRVHGVLVESPWTPWRLHEDSTGTPWGLHEDSKRTPRGLHEDSTRTPRGLHMDSMRTPRGLQEVLKGLLGLLSRLWRIHEESTRSPWGVHEDLWSPWGVHGDPWGTVKYRPFWQVIIQ